MPEPPGMRATVFPVVGRLRFAGDLEPNMADRLGALVGSLQVESAPLRGTTVSGAIPVGAGTGAR